MFIVVEDEAEKSCIRISKTFTRIFSGEGVQYSDTLSKDADILENILRKLDQGAKLSNDMIDGASDAARKLVQSYNLTQDSVDQFIESQKNTELQTISANKSFSNCCTILNEYNDRIVAGGGSSQEFIDAVGKGNPALSQYIQGLNGAKGSIIGYTFQTVKANAATIAMRAGVMALNAAVSMGLMAAFQVIVSVVREAVVTQEEARDAANETAKAYKETSKSINDYIQRISELREEIDNGNLSEKEAYEKRKDLISIQDQLIEKFGDEAAGVDLVTGSIEKQISALENLSKRQYDTWFAEHIRGIDDMKDVYEKDIYTVFNSFGRQFSVNEFEKSLAEMSQEQADLFSKYITINEWLTNGWGSSEYYSFSADSYLEGIEVLTKYIDTVRELDSYKQNPEQYNNVLTKTSDYIGKLKKKIEEYQETYETWVSGELEYNSTYADIWNKIEAAKENYSEALAKDDSSAAQEAITAMQEAEKLFLSAGWDEELINSYVQEFINTFYESVKQNKLRIELDLKLKDKNNSLSNDLQKVLEKLKTDKGSVNLDSILNEGIVYDSIHARTNNPQAFSEAQLAYANLKTVADEYEVEVEDLVNALADLGYIQLEVSETGDNTHNGTEKIISNYREIVTALRQAVTEYNTNGYITVDTYNSLAKHGEDYADLCVHTAEGIKLQSDEVATLTEELNQVTGAELAAANASDATIRSTLALASSLLKTSSSTDASLDAISDLVEMQKELEEGTQYSSTEMMELVEQYPQLAGHVEELTKGYGFEADAVRELVAELTELYKKNELLKTQSARTSLATAYNGRYALTADNVDKTFENFASANDGKQITSREDYIIQWKIDFPERTDEDAEKIVSEVWDYVDARIEANVKGEIADRVATGNAQPGYTPKKSEKEETEFERQYKYHNHLLNMDKESVEDYLAWLRVAYIASYNAGEMELDDFYKYKEEVYEKDKELFADSLSDMEHRISLLGNANIDNSDEIVSMYEDMQRRVHEKANEYREAGLDDNHEILQELQNQWWSYEQAIEKIREEEFDSDLDKINFNIDTLKLNNANSNEILSSYQDILRRINEEIDRYTSEGYDISHEKIRDLTTKLRDTKDEIIDYLNEFVEKANDAVDGYQNVYTTLTDAAKEYASTGALSVDSFQSILELGPKYLSFLYDENGQLTIYKESIKQVFAAKTEELAVETALAYAKQVLQAAQENNISKIVELTSVSAAGTASTWEMAYATLGLAKAIGTANGMDANYFDNAADNLAKIQSMSKTAVNTIDTYYATL